jgi:hypothetical protein
MRTTGLLWNEAAWIRRFLVEKKARIEHKKALRI